MNFGNGWRCCRFPACSEELPHDLFFCEEHKGYRRLTDDLFGRDRTARTINHTEPLTAVYVIGCRRTNAIKIGIAMDVIGRIAQLQTGYPFPLKLFGAFYTKRRWAETLEKACHLKLKEYDLHLHGEWFEIEPDDGVRLVLKLAEAGQCPVLNAGEYGTMLATWDDIDHDIHDHLAPVRRKIKRDWASEMIDKASNPDKTRL